MNDGPTRPPRLRSNDALRLEGLVVQKRLGRVEKTCYLVIDFMAGSISVYKSPPPSSDQPRSPSRSLPSKLLSSATPNFSRSKSDSGEGVRKVSNLTHLSRQLRDFERGLWDPKFTVPSSMGWKIRYGHFRMLAKFILICLNGLIHFYATRNYSPGTSRTIRPGSIWYFHLSSKRLIRKQK